MFHNFTRRHKLDFDPSPLKYENIPMRFRLDILKMIMAATRESENPSIHEYSIYQRSAISINKSFEILNTVDEIAEYYSSTLFVDLLEKAKWHEVISLIEHLINVEEFHFSKFNELFNYYCLGYEINKSDEDAISDEHQELIVTVKYDRVMEKCDELIDSGVKFHGVIESIRLAKDGLVNPHKIDLANSVKNSISAVEGFLKGYYKPKKIRIATLGDAIKLFRKEKDIPEEVIDIAEKLYIFRNRTDNVGHGSPNLPDFDNDDAYLFLDLSISFINYFYKKGQNQKI